MSLSCSAKCIKFILFVFNFIFWVSGAVLLGIGIWILAAHSNATYYLHIANLDYGLVKGAAITIVVVGSLVFLVGGLGCCGACRENTTCLTAFSGFLILLLVLQVIALILAASLHNQIVYGLGKGMASVMSKDYGRYDREYVTESWNFMQIEMKCCGVGNRGPLGWNYTYWWKHNKTIAGPAVPDSCCVHLNDTKNYKHPVALDPQRCYNAAFDTSMSKKEREKEARIQGCEDSLNDWFMDQLGIFIGVVVAVIIIQIVVVVMACVLKSSIKQSNYEHI